MTKKKFLVFAFALLAALVAAACAVVIAIDLIPPKLQLVDSFEGGYGQPISLYQLIEKASDREELVLSVSGDCSFCEQDATITFATIGLYPIEVTATNAEGRSTTESLSISIVDLTPPELLAEDFPLYIGTEPDYLSHVVAHDEIDGDLTSIVTVDNSQVVPTQAGRYRVVYRVQDGAGNQASQTVFVEVTEQPAEQITLDLTYLHLSGNEYHQLTAAVLPDLWTGNITWTTSNADVATVSDGLVVWTGVGSCVITAQADHCEAQCTVECSVPVAQSVWLSQHELTLEAHEQAALEVQVFPSNWSGEVVWSSSNSLVAEVVDGVVYWKGQGVCEITATADGQSDTCTVTCAAENLFFQWSNHLFHW